MKIQIKEIKTYIAATWKGADRCDKGKQEDPSSTSAIAPAAISNNHAVKSNLLNTIKREYKE